MIKVLHIINFLCLGGAARSMIAISKYSSRLDAQFQHQVISLKKADPRAVELAELGGMKFIEPVDEMSRNQLIAEADIVHIHYWNNPQIFSFLHSELPPTRLIIWFHVSGDSAPQVITRDLINYADFAIPCNPHSYDLPVVRQFAPEIRQKKVGMVYDAADFERVHNIQPKPHDTFNVGYMEGLAFTKMHPEYISMSAKANIPNVQFILCGGGNIDFLQQQASQLGALHKFNFRGFVEDISSVIAEFDVYGYPLCEDTYAAAELNLQEIMYAGIPPIVFPHGGIKKLVIDNYTGLVANSELEYSQALEYLYHHPEERLRLGNNAKQYAEKLFGAENAAKQLNPIYHRLMEMPKRSRQWSIPVDGSLLDEPVSLLDVVDIPSQFEGAKTFIESIGDTAPQFITSLTSEDINQLFDADFNIANSSDLLKFGEGGVLQYVNYYQQDGYLRLWLALILERQEKTQEAMGQFINAINFGCNHWRVFWYLAQSAERLQETSVLQQALDTLINLVPDFTSAQEMRKRLKKLLNSESDLSSLNLKEINYIIFPDWFQSEDLLGLELQEVIKNIATHPNSQKTVLLIDTTNISVDDAELFLSGITMNLLMNEELDGTDELEISFLGELSDIQWKALRPHINSVINLENQNHQAFTNFQSILQKVNVLDAINTKEYSIQNVKYIYDIVEKYHQGHSEPSVTNELSNLRKQMAEYWLSVEANQLEKLYTSTIGEGYQAIVNSGIQNQELTESEQQFVNEVIAKIAKGFDEPKLIQYLLVAILYCRPQQLPLLLDLVTCIPNWLLNDYLQFTLQSPLYFQDIGEADSYYLYMEKLVNYLHSNIFANSDSQLWQNVANYFAEKANFIPLYFNENNSKAVYQKRAETIELYLKNINLPIEYEFLERSLQRKKIRLGILAYHFGVQTETFAALPIYKHLNRDLFEVILFPIKTSNHRLERYCAGHSDELVILPNNLQEQVQTIRDADLDVLFISTNLTAVTNQVTLLASHRLARIQMVDANSPVSTGMRHIDYYISSKLSEPKENAQSHYTEKLITLDVPPQCFDFATEEQIVATTSLSRDSLGIDPNAIVYISGANFYKILPEVELTWTKIIDRVPNSVLVLYPFNPNWSSSYPVAAFRKRISNTFAKYGLSEERLIILDPAPNRADVQERLKLADIYLDSYPYSGMTSLIDPLQVGLPSIVLEGKTSRSQKGASLLRSLRVTDLITDSEETYIQLAVELGTNPDLRKQKSDRINQKMQQNPSFLDSRSYSAQMGALFQQLFQQYRAKNLIDQLGLRDINLVMFPDWHQSEESLYEDLANVLKTMSSNPDTSRITLLIDTDGIDGEDANWMFSSVAMNLLMEEAVDIADELEVSLLDDLTENEWELLLSLTQGKISLNNENQNAIAKAKAESLEVYS